MPHNKAFASAKLQGNGTVEVTGPFTRAPGEADRLALVAFCLVQGSTKVYGDGRWLPGELEWTGTADSGLKAGPAHGSALAVSPHENGPGFVTFSWDQPVDIT